MTSTAMDFQSTQCYGVYLTVTPLIQMATPVLIMVIDQIFLFQCR